MVFIAGSERQWREAAEGEFHCLACGLDRSFTLYQLMSRATLYFVPLGSGTATHEQVVCGYCRASYNRSILAVPTTPVLSYYTQLAMRVACAGIVAGSPDHPSRIAAAVGAVRSTGMDAYDERSLIADVQSAAFVALPEYLVPLAAAPNLQGRQRFVTCVMAVANASGADSTSDYELLATIVESLGLANDFLSQVHYLPPITPDGWYPDPSGVAVYRWWDGSICRWTHHVAGGHTEVRPPRLLPQVAPGHAPMTPEQALHASGSVKLIPNRSPG